MQKKQALEATLCLLKSPDAKQKRLALTMLGELKKFFGRRTAEEFEETIECIIPLLNSENPEVRYDAVQALGKLGSPKSFQALIAHENKEEVKRISSAIKVWIGSKKK